MNPRLSFAIAITCILCVCSPPGVWARKPWIRFDNCRLVPNKSNDGDSFHVQANGRHYYFRLEFVDAPETNTRHRKRVEDQAKYFGLTANETLQVGEEAKRFTEQILSQRTFTILTNKLDARGQSKKKRYYAFVLMDDKDLGAELVANGLARVYGHKTKRPDNTPVGAEYSKLKRLEEIAKTQKIGAWGLHSGGLQRRVQSQEKFQGDSFDRFFHPEKFGSPSPASRPQ